MAGYSKVTRGKGLGGKAGRKSGRTEDVAGKTGRPRGGAGPAQRGRQPSTMAVKSGSSGKALYVGKKQR